MTSEGIARAWDLVVVPFPYSERLAEKRRPAIVVSNANLHREGYVWVAMVTGAGKAGRTGDVQIRDLEAAGLPSASTVRTSKVATIEPGRILRRIGSLAEDERLAVKQAIAAFSAQ